MINRISTSTSTNINTSNSLAAMAAMVPTSGSTQNVIQVFKNEQFGSIRTTVIDGEPWFVGKDVAERLGYADTFGAINKHVDDEDKQNCQNSSFESPRGMTIINESGVYSLILRSQLPTAKQFKRWVTSVVLPAIRKRGAYIPNFCDPAAAAEAWAQQYRKAIAAENQVKQLAAKVTELQPKVDYCDKVLSSETALTISQIGADFGLSAQKLNKQLFDLGIQVKVRGQWLLTGPYQDKGYTVSHTHAYDKKSGATGTAVHTLWTQKGRLFIYSKLKEKGINPIR